MRTPKPPYRDPTMTPKQEMRIGAPSIGADAARMLASRQSGMRMLVCGGRDFADKLLLTRTLDGFNKPVALTTILFGIGGPIATIIHGGAKGADTLAGEWADENDIPLEIFNADWQRHGPKAGPIRNNQMLRDGKPDVVVAFPGGIGTTHMINIACAARVKVLQVDALMVRSLGID